MRRKDFRGGGVVTYDKYTTINIYYYANVIYLYSLHKIMRKNTFNNK